MELRQRKRDHPSQYSREEERKSSWDYGEKKARKEYTRSQNYSNEYRESCSSSPNARREMCFQSVYSNLVKKIPQNASVL